MNYFKQTIIKFLESEDLRIHNDEPVFGYGAEFIKCSFETNVKENTESLHAVYSEYRFKTDVQITNFFNLVKILGVKDILEIFKKDLLNRNLNKYYKLISRSAYLQYYIVYKIFGSSKNPELLNYLFKTKYNNRLLFSKAISNIDIEIVYSCYSKIRNKKNIVDYYTKDFLYKASTKSPWFWYDARYHDFFAKFNKKCYQLVCRNVMKSFITTTASHRNVFDYVDILSNENKLKLFKKATSKGKYDAGWKFCKENYSKYKELFGESFINKYLNLL